MSCRPSFSAILPLCILTLTACGGSEAKSTGAASQGGGSAGSVSGGGAESVAGSSGSGTNAGSGNAGTDAKAGNSSGGAIGNGGASGGGASGGGAGGGASMACPTDVPAAGSACPLTLGRCTWGNAPLLTCRTSATCTTSGWQLKAPPAYCTMTDPGCAALLAGGATCSDTSLKCLSNETSLCSCTPCNCETPHPPGPPCADCPMGQPLGTPVRFCRSALTLAPPCPAVVPNAGAACEVEGRSCPQSACDDTIAVCTGGVWQWTQSSLCPGCASPDTPIATPLGERPIAELQVGDSVYSVENSAVVLVPLSRVSRTPVSHHRVVRLVLEDGRTLEISAGHPTADGHAFGDLRAGSRLDGHPIISAEVVPYTHAFTYDVLPASNTGTYFAAGALIGSTLEETTRSQ